MRLALMILALTGNVLMALLLVAVVFTMKMDFGAVVFLLVFLALLGLNSMAIIFHRRPRAGQMTAQATAHTFD
ncbi:MAG TPA: hypothetical protein VHW60_12920 [Caulobacteraceae bacterium]|jgi:hypothetical protein|nr:hypothetical protein [Caulobacteraceae bacterium]